MVLTHGRWRDAEVKLHQNKRSQHVVGQWEGHSAANTDRLVHMYTHRTANTVQYTKLPRVLLAHRLNRYTDSQ